MQSDIPDILEALGRLDSERKTLESFLTAVAGFYAELDGWVRGLAEEQGIELACRPGCFHCCPRSGVEAELFEVIPIVARLNQAPSQSLFERIISRSDEVLAGVGRGGGSFLSLLNLKESPREKSDPEDACPFLQAGLCGIYPVRPVACRIHVSLSSRSCAEALRPELPREFYTALERGIGLRLDQLGRQGLASFMGHGSLLVHWIGWEEGEESCSVRVMGRRYVLSQPGG